IRKPGTLPLYSRDIGCSENDLSCQVKPVSVPGQIVLVNKRHDDAADGTHPNGIGAVGSMPGASLPLQPPEAVISDVSNAEIEHFGVIFRVLFAPTRKAHHGQDVKDFRMA